MINQFVDDYKWLSNFYPCLVELDGMKYQTVENAYQSAKNPDLKWKEFCANKSPAVCKTFSKHVVLTPRWDVIKVRVMRKLLNQKFNQDYFKELLLATDNEGIVEGNTWHDTFWGVDLMTSVGQNRLGIMIMNIREALRSGGRLL